MTRDKLVGLLWPDSDSERASHSLTQALYAARRALGVNDLFVIDGPISLNGRRISSDIADVERALADGNREAAIEAYTGPFLDGFYVSGASEFERWVSTRRDAVEERIAGVLELLAKQACDGNELDRAIGLRRRLGLIRPLDSGNVTSLVVLLGLAGRRAEAIHQAHVHTELIEAQLGLPPDQALLVAVDRLRETRPPRPRMEQQEPPPPADEPVAESGQTQGAVLARRSGPPRRQRFRSAAIVAAAIALISFSVVALHRFGGAANRRAIPSPASPATLMVAPFDVSGASARAAYLGKAVVQLLGPRLTLDSTVRAIDADVTLGAWRRRGFQQRVSVPRDSLLRLAADLGARQLVVGAVVGDRARSLLSASVISVPRGRTLAQASVEGPATRLAGLTRELAAKLLVAQAGDSERVAVRWAHSYAALRHYAIGRLTERRGDPAASVRAYEKAIALEPSFATAALRLAVAADRLGNAEQEAGALAKAWAHRDMLDDEERPLLMSFVGPRYPEPSPAAEQLDAWEMIARLNDQNPSMWQQLAANLFHEGPRLGVSTIDHATSAVERALELRDGYGPADELRNVMRGPEGNWLGAIDDRLEDTTLSAIRAVAMASLWRGMRVDAGARAIALLGARAATTDERIDAILAEHSLALNRGRSADALAATGRLHEVKPDSHSHLRLQVLDAIYGGGDSTAAALAVSLLSRRADSIFRDFPLARRRADADGCVVGQWRLAHNDTTGVDAIARELLSERVWHEPSRGSVSWGVCGELLNAALAVATGRPDALSRVDRLDGLILSPAVAGNTSMYAHLLVSRLYERLGHLRRALAAVRKRDEMLGWPTYLVATLHREWRLANAVGDVEGATLARQRYIACHGGDGGGL